MNPVNFFYYFKPSNMDNSAIRSALLASSLQALQITTDCSLAFWCLSTG